MTSSQNIGTEFRRAISNIKSLGPLTQREHGVIAWLESGLRTWQKHPHDDGEPTVLALARIINKLADRAVSP
jgi:hypothetical protein